MATLLVVGTGAVATSAASPDEPVQATAAAQVGDPGSDGATTTTTVRQTTTTSTTSSTTTVPPTTAPPTTAAPTTTAPPPPPPTTAPPPPPPSGPVNGTRNTGCEQYMYNHINGARAAAGVAGLAFDYGIQSVPLNWTDHMVGQQVLAHNPNYADQILQYRNWYTAGENVGRGYDLDGLFQAFMNSPGHRANIEKSAYTHVSVGCLTDGSGQLWVTQNFWG